MSWEVRMSKMKVLYVSPEVLPFAKTGGLADVAGALPKSLAKNNIDIRVIMPKYKNIPDKFVNKMLSIATGTVDILFREVGFEVYFLEENNVKYYFIEHKVYFERDGYYGYNDDGERFTFFSKAVLETLPLINFQPDIIHSNDWQTGVISLLLKANYEHLNFYKNIKTVFTIHNIKYQGVFPKEVVNSLLGISWDHFQYDKLEFFDQVNYLKAGTTYSDVVNTVSKSYAKEIQFDFFAENLGDVIRSRSHNLYGIVNGIDFDVFNPETDENIFAKYSYKDLKGKYINKANLQKLLKLPEKNNVPVIGLVSRLVDHKGLDLIECVLEEILAQDVQVVVLGAGEYKYEEMFKYFAFKYPEKLSANIMYNSVLAQRIYAGCDMFLMPSLFEPCGLGQLISLRYGTVPIVRETGGLKDTITPYDEFTGKGNGFSFANYNAHDMLFTINKAIKTFHEREHWREIILTGMQEDFSWNHSALEYISLYKKVFDESKPTSKKANTSSSTTKKSTKNDSKKKVILNV
jgi:starch synthase